MKRILLICVLVICWLLLPVLANAANKIVPVGNANKVFLQLSADEPLGGVALALKFAEPGSPVICTSVDFSSGIADYINNDEQNGVKFTAIDNEKKTILAVVIPFTADAIPAGTGIFLNLEFKGEGMVRLEPTKVCHQEGISLVNTKAGMMEFEFNPIEFATKSDPVLPKEFSLSQNYPNPFNPATNISYALPSNAHVKLTIYNLLGQKVKTLVNEQQTAGYKQVIWDGKNDRGEEVGSGIYFYKIEAGNFTKTAKMSLLK